MFPFNVDTAMWSGVGGHAVHSQQQTDVDSRPPSATSLHPWHHQPPPRPPPPRVYASTSNLPDCFPVIDPLHHHPHHHHPHHQPQQSSQLSHHLQSSPVNAMMSLPGEFGGGGSSGIHSRHPIPPFRSRASTLDRSSSENRLKSTRSTSYSHINQISSPQSNLINNRSTRATTVERSLYHEKSQVQVSSTGSTLNLKVWKQDEEGNFTKYYPNHHRRNSMVTLDQNERMKRYAEIQREVQEKYFNRSSSVDCLQTTTTIAASQIRQFNPFTSNLQHHQRPGSVTPYEVSNYPLRGPSASPIRSVTAKILSTFDVARPKRGPSKEQLFQTMMTQQQQLQHLTSQQQYLQAQILWQQKQLREAEIELLDRSRSRSRNSKEEQLSDKEIEKARKISTRMEIQETLHKQQTQVAQHILNLQTQLNLLMQRTTQQQQQPAIVAGPLTSSVSNNNNITSNNNNSNTRSSSGKNAAQALEPIEFTSAASTRDADGDGDVVLATDVTSTCTQQGDRQLNHSQNLQLQQEMQSAHLTSQSLTSRNEDVSIASDFMDDHRLKASQLRRMDREESPRDDKVTKKRPPPLITPEMSLEEADLPEVESNELRFEIEEDERPRTPDPSQRNQFLSPKYNRASPPAESDFEDPDEVWLPEDENKPFTAKITSVTDTTPSPSLPPLPFGGRRGAFKPLSPMNSIVKQKSTDSRDTDFLDYTDLEEEDLDLPLPFDVEDDLGPPGTERERRQRIREQIKWEIEDEKRKQAEKDAQEERIRRAKEQEIENELQLKRLEREAAFLREMEEREVELKKKQNELMRQAENEMLRQQQEFLNQQKLLLEQQEQLAKQRSELEYQQQQLAIRQEQLVTGGDVKNKSTTSLLPPKPQRLPRRASADEMAIDASTRVPTKIESTMRASVPQVESTNVSSSPSHQMSSSELDPSRQLNNLNQPQQITSTSPASLYSSSVPCSLVPPESIVRPNSPVPPSSTYPNVRSADDLAKVNSTQQQANRLNIFNKQNTPATAAVEAFSDDQSAASLAPPIPARTFAELNSERNEFNRITPATVANQSAFSQVNQMNQETLSSHDQATSAKVLAPSAVQLEKDISTPTDFGRRRIRDSHPVSAISAQESFVDHFDQYSSRPVSALAMNRRAGSRARSQSKEPEPSTPSAVAATVNPISGSKATLSRQESGSIHGGSRFGLSTTGLSDSTASPFDGKDQSLASALKSSDFQRHPLIGKSQMGFYCLHLVKSTSIDPTIEFVHR